MKKILLLLSIITAGFLGASAQEVENETNPVNIKALYVAYVTQQLQLTPDEAQKFWPQHSQFEHDLKSVRKELPELDKQQARLNIKKKYQNNFNNILGPNRCERFFKMDGDFKRKLLDRVKDQRKNQTHPRRKFK